MGMTIEEYRQRMIEAFSNAGCEELIAIVVQPEEQEFKHLEWLLKNFYKKHGSENKIRAIINRVKKSTNPELMYKWAFRKIKALLDEKELEENNEV